MGPSKPRCCQLVERSNWYRVTVDGGNVERLTVNWGVDHYPA